MKLLSLIYFTIFSSKLKVTISAIIYIQRIQSTILTSESVKLLENTWVCQFLYPLNETRNIWHNISSFPRNHSTESRAIGLRNLFTQLVLYKYCLQKEHLQTAAVSVLQKCKTIAINF